MNELEYDDACQMLIAHRILEGTHPAWHEALKGNISAAEAAARAQRTEPEERVAAAVEVFGRSPDPKVDAGRLEELMGLYGASVPRAGPAGAPKTTTNADIAPATAQAPTRRSWILWGGLAAAAAILLTVLLLRVLVAEPLPLGTHYEAELLRDSAELRGDDEPPEVLVYREDRELEIWLRPATEVKGPVEVVIEAVGAGTRFRLSIEPRILDKGVVHIVQPVATTGLTPGDWTLWLFVGRAGTLTRAFDPTEAAEDDESRPYDVQTVRVRIASPDATIER